MAKTVTSEDFGDELAEILSDYTKEVATEIDAELDATAKLIAEEARAAAPKKTGKYAKGFAVKKVKKDGESKRVVYNKTKPHLVHLLEFGHAKRGGVGRVEGVPHFKPAYEKHVNGLSSRIKNIIKG